jgi:serine/threonine protein kinase
MTTLVLPNILENTYKIKNIIGSGGMGDVYLATDLRLDRTVAVKVLKFSSSSEKDALERFSREAKAVAKLSHPNIVSIFDVGETNNFNYMVMEYVEGKNLNLILDKNQLSLKLAIKIIRQLCDVVDFIHSKDIIHRDIKTANIIVNSDFNIKLTDFGIAKVHSQLNLTQDGSMLGSVLYAPPEQFINSQNIDKRADLYSLGVCFYEMLVGFPPFGDKNNVAEIIHSIIASEPKLPSEFRNDIPVTVDYIIKKLLAKNPDERYQNSKEVIKDLDNIEKEILLSQTQSDSNNFMDTLRIKGVLSEELRAQVKDTRLSNSLDLNNTTLNLNDILDKVKLEFSWIKNILETYQQTICSLSFSDLKNKIRELDLSGKRFSGVATDENFYLFIYEGFIIGAIDINSKSYGNKVLESISNRTIVSKIIPMPDNNILPILIYSAITLDGISVGENLNSLAVNLYQVFEEFKPEKNNFTGFVLVQKSSDISTEKLKYFMSFINGELSFSLQISKDNKNILCNIELDEFLSTGNILIKIFKPKLEVLKSDINDLMTKSSFYLKYKDNIDGTLKDIIDLGKEEVTHCFSESVKNNIYFDIKLNTSLDKVSFLDQEISIKSLAETSEYYKACLWIVTEFLFMVNMSGNIPYFKDMYKTASMISHFSILDELSGYYGCSNEYSLVAKDFSGNVMFLGRFGNGSRLDIESFLEETILVKKNLQKSKKKELFSAFYISENKIDNEAISYYYKNVKAEAGIFNKAKAYVKVGFTDGFNALLVQKTDNEYSLAAPNLNN